MTRNKLALVLVLILGTGAIAGGIAYAQTGNDVLAGRDFNFDFDDDFDFDQDPGTPRAFSLFVGPGAFLGVSTEDISKENMGRYGMREVRGVGITQVHKDSPAEKAGLRKDDVIVRFDGESVTSIRKLNRLVSESSPDQTVRIGISRGGAEQEVSATLSNRKFNSVMGSWDPKIIEDDVIRSLPRGNWPQSSTGDGDSWVFHLGNGRRIGVSTQTLSKQLADYFGVKEGAQLISSVIENSPAAKAGIKAGDVITSVDGENIDSAGDLTRVINKKQEGSVSLNVVRDRNSRTVTVTPEKGPDRSIFRPGTMGTRRISIPSIRIPVMPEMNIQIPRIVVPATPSIDVNVPRRAPRVRQRVLII